MSCSELSRLEPLAGTATRADRWLAVEHRAAWGRDAVTESGLPAAVTGALEAYDGRVVLVRRPDRRASAAPAVFFARPTEAGGVLARVPIEQLEDLVGLDLERAAEPIAGNLVLVCAHGRRDACCARLGLHVFDALRPHVAADRLWLSSHLGGHRFAANVVALPAGIQLGRVEPAEAAELATALEEARIPLARYRGRSLHPPEAQAAEAAIRVEHGLDRIADVRRVAVAGETFAFETPGGVVTATVEEHAGPELPPSCGAEPEPTRRLIARIVS